MQQLQFRFEPELAAITYLAFREALQHFPYGSDLRVGIQLLAATGSRIQELDAMDPANLLDDVLHWCPGKNQKGLRHERLPVPLVEEITYHRRHHRVTNSRLLGPNAQTLTRKFNKERTQLNGAWTERRPRYRRVFGRDEGWRCTLKGFRKTFQTVLFAYFYKKYGDAYVAAEMVAKRMKHSDKGITLQHYIEDYTRIDINRWLAWLNTGFGPHQARLSDYQEEQSIRERALQQRFAKRQGSWSKNGCLKTTGK